MRDKVLVETSARHVHVTDEHLEILFGKGAKLTPVKELSQPGQYASEQRVTIVGPRSSISNVVILGPTRKATQVEVSATDARALGIPAVIRESGDIKGTPGCILVGPKGQVKLEEGVIVAARHIHMHTDDAPKFGLKDKDVVKVRVGKERALIFENVIVRVHPEYALDMHIDIEEGNAAGINNGDLGEIIRE